jgi:hypothetical protein
VPKYPSTRDPATSRGDPDTRLATLDRGGGRRRGVFDVDVREDAATVADDWEPTLAEDPA